MRFLFQEQGEWNEKNESKIRSGSFATIATNDCVHKVHSLPLGARALLTEYGSMLLQLIVAFVGVVAWILERLGSRC
jgi:hypothetical protein